MTEQDKAEIVENIRRAKYPKRQVQIEAELHDCHFNTIWNIGVDAGIFEGKKVVPKEKKRAFTRSAIHYARHKEEYKARNAKYRAEHKEEIRARMVKYRAKHKEEKKAYDAKYHAEHREEINRRKREHCQQLKEMKENA